MKKKQNRLAELVTQVKELQNKMKKEGQFALNSAFAEFFEAYPNATEIVWSQFTPYFNDGDSCHFSVNEFELRVNPDSLSDDVKKFYDPEDEDGGYGRGNSCACYALRAIEDTKDNRENTTDANEYYKKRYAGVTLRSLTEEEKSMIKDFKELELACHQIPEILETVLGDHVSVIATKEGFRITDYDHD